MVSQVPPGCKVPLDQQTIYEYYDSALKDTEGEFKFLIAYEAASYFIIPPGEYVMVVFTNDPDVPKDFALVVASRKGYRLQLKYDITAVTQ